MIQDVRQTRALEGIQHSLKELVRIQAAINENLMSLAMSAKTFSASVTNAHAEEGRTDGEERA